MPTDIHYVYSTDDKTMENAVNILTPSVDSVQMLYGIANNNASLIGNLSTVYSDKEDEYASLLLKKLIAKAGLKAAEIAGASNIKIGNKKNEAYSLLCFLRFLCETYGLYLPMW